MAALATATAPGSATPTVTVAWANGTRGRDVPVAPLLDSSALLGNGGAQQATTALEPDWPALRARLARDGYLYLPGLIDARKTRAARQPALKFLARRGLLADAAPTQPAPPGGDADDGGQQLWWRAAMRPGAEGMTLSGCRPATHAPAAIAVLEGAELNALFRGLFDGEPFTYDTKWMRCVGKGEATGAHSDAYFFRAATHPGLLVCWTPLHDVPLRMGPLAVCPGTHLLPGFDAPSPDELPASFYALMDGGGAGAGAGGGGGGGMGVGDGSASPAAGPGPPWLSGDFAAGDVLVFDGRLVHASLRNTTDEFRISSDTRWQPAAAVAGRGGAVGGREGKSVGGGAMQGAE